MIEFKFLIFNIFWYFSFCTLSTHAFGIFCELIKCNFSCTKNVMKTMVWRKIKCRVVVGENKFQDFIAEREKREMEAKSRRWKLQDAFSAIS